MSERSKNSTSSLLGLLSSLKLTVTLFALAIFLIFVGTLAQVDHDVWFVVEQGYFRVWFAWVEWQTFHRLVEMFTKAEPQPVTGGFWFPGGKLIGAVMAINLLAAHSLRFKISAKGARLGYGLAITLVGLAATAWSIASGMDDAHESQLSPEFCERLWQVLRASLAVLGLAGAFWSAQRFGKIPRVEWWFALALDAVLLLCAAWLFANSSVRIDDAGMRILWQLAKGGGAAAVLLAGCYLLFKKRAGIVLLHAGIGLLLANELVVDLTVTEGNMAITEGESANYAYDIRKTELAVIFNRGDEDQVTVVPQSILENLANSNQSFSHPDLPFNLRVWKFYENSMIGGPMAAEENSASAGLGLSRVALPVRSSSGVESAVNQPSAYVELLQKETGDSLGTWLVSVARAPVSMDRFIDFPEQAVQVGDGTYRFSLRFKRDYKEYTLALNKFSFDRYLGTNKAKNFSSDLVLSDPTRGVEREVRVWMNNPLRYAGDTIYQADFDKATERTTILQVVSNESWMIPYVSCMLVGLGMLAHFGVTLTSFVRRRNEEAQRARVNTPRATMRLDVASPLVWAPALSAVICGAYLLSKARPAEAPDKGFHVTKFAELPVAHGGRIKPIDTLARNALQALSGRQEVKPAEEGGRTISAAEWLLELSADRPGAHDHRVFRVENLEVLELLGLPNRPGSYRYTYNEVIKERAAFEREVLAARRLAAEGKRLSLVQNKVLELSGKLSDYHLLTGAFGSPRISLDKEKIQQEVQAAMEQADLLDKFEAPRAVAPDSADVVWMTLFRAEMDDLARRFSNQTPNPATVALSRALGAYAENKPAEFNAQLAKLKEVSREYEQTLSDPEVAEGLAPAERLSMDKVRFETFFNNFSPFYYCAATYLIAFVLTACSWLGWSRPFGRCATAVILVTLLVHTFALVARIYISGRPPVTNLYSSAVFIGWGAVLFGLAFEAIYRLGVGNAVASALGFSTLLVAYFLSLDGDTFTVLQAVLDTQFWLATHVVCITLGYSTTFLAGFLGIASLVAGHALGQLSDDAQKKITRMTYGVLCFATFFSFIGTVLGGLWADDSWGRFWGWDPKENGALIIVLWNALVLHARWGKMIGPVGLATLAVVGNIVTAWSWFGVNELGVGLHAYGANDSPTAMVLLGFVATQLVVVAIGCLPFRRKSELTN